MKEIKKYISKDGKVFDNPVECADYEKAQKEKEKIRIKKLSDDFLLSVGFNTSKFKSVSELNAEINRHWLIFDKFGKIYGLKTCNNSRNGKAKSDFQYVSGENKKDPEIMENWLRKNKLYGHALCSFVERRESFYQCDMLRKLQILGWYIKDNKIVKTAW